FVLTHTFRSRAPAIVTIPAQRRTSSGLDSGAVASTKSSIHDRGKSSASFCGGLSIFFSGPLTEAVRILPQSRCLIKAALCPIPANSGFERHRKLASAFEFDSDFQQFQRTGEELSEALVWKLEEDGVVDGKEEFCLRHIAPEVEPAPVEFLPRVALRIVGDGRAQRVLVLIAVEEDTPATEEIGKGANLTELLLNPTVPIPLIEAFIVVAEERKSLEVYALESLKDVDFYLGVSCHCGRGAEVICPVAKFLRHISLRVLTVERLFRDFLVLFEIARPAQSR